MASSSSLSPPKMPGRGFFPLRQRRLSWAGLMTLVFAANLQSRPHCTTDYASTS
jgi:hypothetical protein